MFCSAGDLHDDTNSTFVREYQRALSVVCHTLFFAQHPQESHTVQKLAATLETDAKSAGVALQKLFVDSPTEDAQTRIVEDLLDLKILPDVDAYGHQFSAERIKDR